MGDRERTDERAASGPRHGTPHAGADDRGPRTVVRRYAFGCVAFSSRIAAQGAQQKRKSSHFHRENTIPRTRESLPPTQTHRDSHTPDPPTAPVRGLRAFCASSLGPLSPLCVCSIVCACHVASGGASQCTGLGPSRRHGCTTAGRAPRGTPCRTRPPAPTTRCSRAPRSCSGRTWRRRCRRRASRQ